MDISTPVDLIMGLQITHERNSGICDLFQKCNLYSVHTCKHHPFKGPPVHNLMVIVSSLSNLRQETIGPDLGDSGL